MSELKRTPLYDTHKNLGARLFAFAGWDMPVEYEGLVKEHNMVRESAGLFDVSHMGEVIIKGKDSEKFIQNLITNDIKDMKNNEVIYSPMCYENGCVVDDLLVYKYNNEHYLLVINAGNISKDLKWIIENSKNYEVDIKDISSHVSQLAIQGPKAESILQKISKVNLSEITFFTFKEINILDIPCIVSRTGYTGEDGFEVYCENKYVKSIWDELLKTGESDIAPIGLGARDTLRFEACLPLYGNEISENISPLEGGLSIFVKLDKENFIGKDVLVNQKQNQQRKIVAFEMTGKGIARHGYDVKVGDKVVGFVTTGYPSPTLNKTVGLAIIDSEYAKIDNEIDIVIRKKTSKAKIVKRPLYKKKYKKEVNTELNNNENNNIYPYIPTTKSDKEKMLNFIGLNSVEELFSDIPENLKLNRALNIESSKSELEVSNIINNLANKNKNLNDMTCFLGAGAYDHYIPSLIKHITSRSEFYTAYTPYQAEISQGTLQVIFEFQSMISSLTGMEIANASMYDGATACVEACFMAINQTRRNKVIVSKTTHPDTRKVLNTYMKFGEFEIEEVDFCNEKGITDINKLKEALDKNSACVLIQNPNFFGIIEELDEIEKLVHENKSMLILSVDPISLGLLKTPGEIGADIAVGEAQALGNDLNFGGPYVGFLATKSKYLRKMPGRIVGQSIDSEGKRAYTLTLQTREQHVRREKATSNICSNQALNALTAAIYMGTMGREGLKEVATQSMKKAHYTYNKLIESGEFEPVFTGKFFKEFAVKSNVKVDTLNNKLLSENILGGYKLEKDYDDLEKATLLCVTEKRTKEEIDKLVSTLVASNKTEQLLASLEV